MADSTASIDTTNNATDTQTSGDQNTTQADAKTQAAPKPTPPVTGDTDGEDTLPDDPATLKRLLHQARKDAAKTRSNAKQQAADAARTELLQQVSKALGLADNQATPEQLAEQIQHETATRRAAETELAVYRAAQGVANVDMLTDSKSFTQSLKDVDITDRAALTQAIKQFVTDHPQYAASQAPAASTIEHSSGSGEPPITAEQFRHMTPAQQNALYQRDVELYRKLAAQ